MERGFGAVPVLSLMRVPALGLSNNHLREPGNKSGRPIGRPLSVQKKWGSLDFLELLFLAGVVFLLEALFFDELALLLDDALAIVWCLEAR